MGIEPQTYKLAWLTITLYIERILGHYNPIISYTKSFIQLKLKHVELSYQNNILVKRFWEII